MNVDTDDLLDSHEVAAELGLSSHRSVSTYRARYPTFPEPVIEKGSGRCTLWLRADLDEWRNAQEEVLSDRKLNAGGLVVGWEYGQMIAAARKLDTDRDGADAIESLESMLVHARALIEFVTGRGRKRSDVLPGQLLKGWKRPSRGVLNRFGRWKTMIDRHLSHITWERGELLVRGDPSPEWDYWELIGELTMHLREFEKAVAAQPGTVDMVKLRHELNAVGPLAPRFHSKAMATTSDTQVRTSSLRTDIHR